MRSVFGTRLRTGGVGGLGAVGGFPWGYFCNGDVFTAWKSTGMGWTFPHEDPAAPSSPPRLLGSSQASLPASRLQAKLLQAGSTVAALQNSWDAEDQVFFLVGSILGLEAWSCRALGTVLAGWGHSCRTPGAAETLTSFFHIIFPHHFPPHKYECSPSAKVHSSN